MHEGFIRYNAVVSIDWESEGSNDREMIKGFYGRQPSGSSRILHMPDSKSRTNRSYLKFIDEIAFPDDVGIAMTSYIL